ncbi:hypothetical protein F4861DRAFT_550918 [Xylaria intraflava]|nr:hypothetical protein F4861DRAFT_550918 [Xylaria intraflava]
MELTQSLSELTTIGFLCHDQLDCDDVGRLARGDYTAANTFLEASCRYKRNLRLTASVLSMRPVDNVGFASEKPVAHRKLASNDLYLLWEGNFLNFLELAILSSRAEGLEGVTILDGDAGSEFLAGEIGLRLFKIMKPEEDVDTNSAPAEIGLDSLVAI